MDDLNKQVLGEQWNRTKRTITPFVLIGLLGGIVFHHADRISSSPMTRWFFAASGVDFDIARETKIILFEHLAPNSLLFVWATVLLLAAIHRTIAGASNRETIVSKGLILPLEDFGSSLAIAWLGTMLGLAGAAVLSGDNTNAGKFMLVSTYPVMYLFEIGIFKAIIWWPGLSRKPIWHDAMPRWALGTRLEGLWILLLAAAFLVFQKRINIWIATF